MYYSLVKIKEKYTIHRIINDVHFASISSDISKYICGTGFHVAFD